MLGDPFGNMLVAGQSPKQSQGRVNFLVEVCDPSEDRQFAYAVNGVVVSDFYTPHFFDPVTAAGVRYSFTGAITKPRTVQRGGYLSWVVPETNEWFQETWFSGSKPKFRSLGVLSGKRTGSLRSTIDGLTPTPLETQRLPDKAAPIASARALFSEVETSSSGRAAALRDLIKKIKAES